MGIQDKARNGKIWRKITHKQDEKLIDKIWQEQIPEKWKEAVLCPIYKNGKK